MQTRKIYYNCINRWAHFHSANKILKCLFLSCTYINTNVQLYPDLESDDALNEEALNSSGRQNTSVRFRIEDFEYNNSVIADRMLLNWETTSFLGVTVRKDYP